VSKTLVTGATGFLGTHLVAELRRRGQATPGWKPSDLRVFSQSRPAALANTGIDIQTGSVTDPAALARALAGVEQVYHLAGFVSRKPDDGPRMFEVHVEGTRQLCLAAQTAGVKRIVLASTSGTIAVSEHEDAGLDEGCDPPLALIGRWPYYASKYYQEETARRGCNGKIELVIVNPSLLLGPGDDRLSSTRDVLDFLAREIPMIPAGSLNFVDARDVAAVLPVAMERGRNGERYLLGGTNWSFAEYLGRLERLTKVAAPRLRVPRGQLAVKGAAVLSNLAKTFGVTTSPSMDPATVEMGNHFWTFASSKAERDLDWKPREAAETLYDTVAYVRTHILGRKPLMNGGRAAAPPA
jgi:dihydroflavonol-4-reductase